MILETDEDFLLNFPDNTISQDFLSEIRWNGSICCPRCGFTKAYAIENGKRFKCASPTINWVKCNHKFSVLSGTRIEDTKLDYRVLLYFIFCFSKNKQISSGFLAKISGTTQKSSYYKIEVIKEIIGIINRKDKSKDTIFLEIIKELLQSISKRSTKIGYYSSKGTSNNRIKQQAI